MKNYPALSRRDFFRLLGIASGSLVVQSSVRASGENKVPGRKIPVKSVLVYSSSDGGDRMTSKKAMNFTDYKENGLPSIFIDEKITYQQISGFGASFNEAGMICLNALDKDYRENVLKNLFDPVEGMGFSVMKAPIAACDFSAAGSWYSYDDVAGDVSLEKFSIARDLMPNGMVSFIKQAARFGKFQIQSPMDFPPDWMMFGLEKGQKRVNPIYYDTLAKYYLKYIQAYADQGITIDYLVPFNEPANDWYSNHSYLEIGEITEKHLGPLLQSSGFNTKIQLCDTANRPEGIQKLPVALDNPAVRKFIHSISVHGYDWNKFDTLTELHNKYPDLPIWMSEVCYALQGKTSLIPPGGPKTLPVFNFKDGEFWGNMIMEDLKHHVSAWIYWNMILDQNGGPWLVSEEHGDPVYNSQHPVVVVHRENKEAIYTGLYYYLGHFSRFIRPGAYRIESKGETDNFNYVACLNPDKTIVVNVIRRDTPLKCNLVWNNKMTVYEFPEHSITSFIWSIA